MTGSSGDVVRILHVVARMNRAGVETWLMYVLRSIDTQRFKMDFLVHTTEECIYDEEIRSLGGRIIPCLTPSNPLQYARNFRSTLKDYGPYDIVHSHVHFYSGYVLKLAAQAGVPGCIAHSHNDTTCLAAKAGTLRKLYLAQMRRWLYKYSTAGFAVSSESAVDLFGPQWQSDPRWKVLRHGVDLEPFTETVDPAVVRSEFGIPPDSLVVGHVGRLVDQKNHRFIVEVMAELIKHEPKAYLLLVGEGPLEQDIRKQAEELGLSDHVVFTGSRPDVPRLMLGAMDVFFLPSLHEGLSLALIEAQAAGLQCLVSDVISYEADIAGSLVHRLSLEDPVAKWVQTLLAYLHTCPVITCSEALDTVKASQFNIETAIKELEDFYVSLL